MRARLYSAPRGYTREKTWRLTLPLPAWKQKATARQWAGIIHQHHRQFRFDGICLDPNGGGVLTKRELVATKPDGTWAFTKRNARQSSALGKKDFA